jgi:hypothetical protein
MQQQQYYYYNPPQRTVYAAPAPAVTGNPAQVQPSFIIAAISFTIVTNTITCTSSASQQHPHSHHGHYTTTKTTITFCFDAFTSARRARHSLKNSGASGRGAARRAGMRPLSAF